MQENEFEKNLQHKLDALQVQPTDEVWQKIKVQVAKKKQKRRFAFLFLLAALLGAATLVTIMENKPAIQKELAVETPGNNDAASIAKTTQPVENSSIQTNTENVSKTAITLQSVSAVIKEEGAQKKKNTATYKNSIAGKPVVSLINASPGETVTKDKFKRKTKGSLKATTIQPTVDDVEDKVDDKVDVAIAEPEAVMDKTTAQEIKKQPNVEVETKITSAENKAQKLATEEENKKVEEKTKEEKLLATSEKNERKQRNDKWGIAFTIAGGRSFVTTTSQEKALAQDYTGGGIGNTPNTGNGAGGNYYIPSALNPGIGFTAGVGVYRKLSPSIKLMLGLQYSFTTLSIKTGKRIDSIPVAFSGRNTGFLYGSSSTYSNKYHYLSLPVSLSAKLFSIGKKEISIDAGITISKLIYSNALEFNSAQGRYYVDDTYLNRTLVGLSLSANINLAAPGKPAFYIGPQLQYNVTPLASTGLHANRHMAFVGLRLQKNLWK